MTTPTLAAGTPIRTTARIAAWPKGTTGRYVRPSDQDDWHWVVLDSYPTGSFIFRSHEIEADTDRLDAETPARRAQAIADAERRDVERKAGVS